MTDRETLGIGVTNRPVPQPFVFRYEIQHPWYDGDSPKVILDHGMHRYEEEVAVRLYGVDTPEMRGSDRDEGIIVRDIVRKWSPVGSKGIIESHKQGTGKYGRLLGTMWPDGWDVSINERLYKAGLADVKTYSARLDAVLKALWDDDR